MLLAFGAQQFVKSAGKKCIPYLLNVLIHTHNHPISFNVIPYNTFLIKTNFYSFAVTITQSFFPLLPIATIVTEATSNAASVTVAGARVL